MAGDHGFDQKNGALVDEWCDEWFLLSTDDVTDGYCYYMVP